MDVTDSGVCEETLLHIGTCVGKLASKSSNWGAWGSVPAARLQGQGSRRRSVTFTDTSGTVYSKYHLWGGPTPRGIYQTWQATYKKHVLSKAVRLRCCICACLVNATLGTSPYVSRCKAFMALLIMGNASALARPTIHMNDAVFDYQGVYFCPPNAFHGGKQLFLVEREWKPTFPPGEDCGTPE